MANSRLERLRRCGLAPVSTCTCTCFGKDVVLPDRKARKQRIVEVLAIIKHNSKCAARAAFPDGMRCAVAH